MIKESIKLKLEDFSSIEIDNLLYDQAMIRHTIPTDIFPNPNLLLFLLIYICNFKHGSVGDKMHWSVSFTYKKNKYSITHEKFGLRLYTENISSINPKEVLGKLKRVLDLVEKNILSEFSKKQISQGNVSINNQFQTLNDQYLYFRARASFEYSQKNIQDSEESSSLVDLMNNIVAQVNKEINANIFGQYNALAMIDSYFSRLEHFLVLSLPFTNYDRKKDDLAEFIGSIWSKKLKRIFKFPNPKLEKHYNLLVHIKEKYRNTFAHGGFEKNGQSLYFHLNGVGAIPVSMSGIKDSVHFENFPIDEIRFKEICKIFDAFDNFLLSSDLSKVWAFAESGLTLSLNEKDLTKLLEVSNDSKEAFDEWIDYMLYNQDRINNADY